MNLAKADAALEHAFLALQNLPGAKFRLHDIMVEEVSLVDRAANKRRFLIVKREHPPMKTQIPQAVKEGSLQLLTKALEQMVSVVSTLRGVSEDGAETEPPTLEAVGEGLLGVQKLLGETLAAYPVAKDAAPAADVPGEDKLKVLALAVDRIMEAGSSDELLEIAKISDLGTEAADKLKALALAMAQIAEAASPAEVEDVLQRLGKTETPSDALAEVGKASIAISHKLNGAPVDAEASTAIKALIATLSKMGLVADDAPAPDAPPAPAATTEPDAPAATEEEEAADTEPPAEGEDGAIAKAIAAQAALLAEVSKAGRKMSGSRLKRLRLAISTLSELLDELDPSTGKRAVDGQPAAPPNAPGDMGNVGRGGPPEDERNVDSEENIPEMQSVLKRLDELNGIVAKMAAKPEAPASRSSEPGGGGAPAPTGDNTNPRRKFVW